MDCTVSLLVCGRGHLQSGIHREWSPHSAALLSQFIVFGFTAHKILFGFLSLLSYLTFQARAGSCLQLKTLYKPS